MSIFINNIKLDKNHLLELIDDGSKLAAIKYIKDHVKIGLKDCKSIVDNLEDNPKYYDGKPFTAAIDLPDIDTKINDPKARKSNHVIKNNSGNVKNIVILILVFCVLFLLLKDKF